MISSVSNFHNQPENDRTMSNYYGPKPQLMKLNFFFYESPKAQYEVYQAGQLDETTIPTDNYTQASMRPDFSKNPDLMISYYSMNYLIKPFDNIYY